MTIPYAYAYLNTFCFVYDRKALQTTILGLFVGEDLHRTHYALANGNPVDTISDCLYCTSSGTAKDGRVLKTDHSKPSNLGIRRLNRACLYLPKSLS
jgi:hypothetical protein